MSVYIKSLSCISPQDTFDPSSFIQEIHQPHDSRLTAIEPYYKDLISSKWSRRMSRLIKMAVASAIKSLELAEVEMPEAIITATGLGCLQDTEKFLSSIHANKEKMLAPTPFIQSTHNTVGGQLALMLQCRNYNYTYSNRGSSFENALEDAIMLINEGRNNILLGAFDELTDSSFTIINNLKCYPVATLGEGSAFYVLSSDSTKSIASIAGRQNIQTPESSQIIFKSAENLCRASGISLSDIDTILLGMDTQLPNDVWYQHFIKHFNERIPVSSFKQLCGEYQTSSAFGLHLACKMIEENKIFKGTEINPKHKLRDVRNILVYNHYLGTNHSLMLVSKP